MFVSIFSDELGMDIEEGLPLIKAWGLTYVDLRTRVFGKEIGDVPAEELPRLRRILDDHGMRVGCLQSSLAKAHLPDKEGQQREADKLEGLIRAAEALDCRLVRSFHFWQPPKDQMGQLAVRPDELQKVLNMFGPLAERAKAAGLILAFENCGVLPDEVFAVLDALDVPNWGMAWDVYNTWDCDERRADEGAFIRRMVRRSKMVHVKATGAVEGLSEPIPYDKVLHVCHNLGVPGPVSAETHNPDPSVSNVDRSRQVVETIQRAWPAAAPGGELDVRSTEGVTRPWQDDPVGFVVVGLGVGHEHAKTLVNTPGVRLIGVCDIVEERAKRTATKFDVPYTTELREWLDNDAVEIVYVVTETGNHAAVARQALEAGKHVLTTKPMEASLAACDDMIRVAEEKGLLLGVDFGRRFNGTVQSLKAAVASEQFGRLLSGNVALKIQRLMPYFQANGGWRGTRKLDGGGVFSNQAIHHIDEVAFTVGIPAKVRTSIWTQAHDIEAEDQGTAVWLYENGMVITFSAMSSYPHDTWYLRYELEGTQGAYLHSSGGPLDDAVTRWYLDDAWSDRAPTTIACEWLNAADNFAAAVRTGAALTCCGRDGRRTQSILDAMYRSANDAEGGWVDVAAEIGLMESE